MSTVAAETKAERRVWELLTHDFRWDPPADFGVKVCRKSEASTGPVKLQVFEVAVAAIFSRLRPDYEWCVTPNLPDGGSDFIGRQQFLEDEALGIAAAITVGGQCKKRGKVGDVVQEVAGSLVNMVTTLNPTFFVVALSARLTESRVEEACARVEQAFQRDCHILDRPQIEGLFNDHLSVLEEILHEGLSGGEIREVFDYFEAYQGARPSISVDVAAPQRVLAGVPFSVALSVRSFMASTPGSRLWWSPSGGADAEAEPVTLIGPVGADGPAGIELMSDEADDPIRAQHSIELVTYSVGKVELGEVLVGLQAYGTVDAAERIELGSVQVVENVRPRFFERPFRAGLTRLGQEYDRALAGGVASIGVIGAGGSGKSRLCEEFALERRRRGAKVVSAKQAKTLDDPRRILADLFNGLVPGEMLIADPADHVIRAIERYDPSLAERAAPAIRSVFGLREGNDETATEQSILSSLLLLIVAQGRRGPLIVHLQDLHWCTADVLLMLERLIWQLDQLLSARDAAPRSPESGILFVFEGRIRERQELGDDGWVSAPFEAFLQKLDCVTVRCGSFTPDDGLEFIRRLFEDRYSARRLASDDLFELQAQLIEQIDRTAGGSPFHSLEQVQLLKERRVLGQNPQTGLLYMIQPAPTGSLLPESVFEAIQLRWRYLQARMPELALLLWAAALLEDRIPNPLFRRLWREIAPSVSLGEVDGTDILWTGDGDTHDVAFRHENYFRSIRRFEVSAEDRRLVVGIYSDWFDGAQSRSAAEQFRWARALLELPEPDVARARALLVSALRDAQAGGDLQLARRISATSLDLTWNEDARSPVTTGTFLGWCDDELALIRDLLGSDRFQANSRLEGLRARLGRRLASERGEPLQGLVELQRRQLTAEIMRSHILFNDRQPAMASEVSARAVSGIRALRADDSSADDESWETLEMEGLHSQAVALALSGEIDEALATAERAVEKTHQSLSPLGLRVRSTYANILLARDPGASETILRECLADVLASDAPGDARHIIEVNLSMALVLRGYGLGLQDQRARAMLAEARELLMRVFASSFQVGRYPDAGAASLMLGVLSALENDGESVSWFAQAVAAASRGHKLESLWRAHINLATALHRREGSVTESVCAHARAAVEIMEETLSPYPQPDRSARFDLIRVPLAQGVRFLLVAGDVGGRAALMRYPGLRASFKDAQRGVLREDRGAFRSHEWLRIGDDDYVIY
jgi:tetratricopeptide (TPR) repeat protein